MEFPDHEPCFCRSGQPFGLCHNKKVYDHPAEIDADHKKFVEWWPDCGVVENGLRCGKEVIGSHSLQRARALTTIAENGHVIGFSGSGYGRTPYQQKSSERLESVSIKKASRFFGLCSKHDNEIFRSIEIPNPTFGYRYIMTCAIRSVLYEAIRSTQNSLFTEWLFSVPKFNFPFNRNTSEQERENAIYYAGYQWDLLRVLSNVSERKSARKLQFFAAKFSGKVDFCTTGNFCIELDLDGNVLQDFSKNENFNYCQITVQQLDDRSWVFILSGVGDKNRAALEKLLICFDRKNTKHLPEAALRMAISHSENTYFRPSWINSLSDSQKAEIVDRFEYGTDFVVGQKKDPASLSRPFSFSVDATCVQKQLVV